MENDWILENERLQIEQIRALEMEELQIEEVDDVSRDSSSDGHSEPGDGGVSPYGGFTFDTYLTSLHTYLGEVDETRGRTAFLDGGAILNLPMFYLEGVVLFPEATLPLRVIQPWFKASVEKAMNQADVPYTIGVIRVYRSSDGNRFHFSKIGTTAEIRQYKWLDDGSINLVTRGQQRFHLRRSWIDVEGAPCAEIQIIQEDIPLRTPKDAFGQSVCIGSSRNRITSSMLPSYTSSARWKRYEEEGDSESDCMSYTTYKSDDSITDVRTHCSSIDICTEDARNEFLGNDNDLCESSQGEKNLNGGSLINHSFEDSLHRKQSFRYWASDEPKWLHRAPRAFWPHWVYWMYDAYSLARRAADMWKQIVGVSDLDHLVSKPGHLSFHIGSKIPISESTRQQLLEVHGISYRLQKEIELLGRFDIVRCKICQTVIAKRRDMVVMSSDGPLNAYANTHGYVHEVMTLYNANGLALIGTPVKEHSWFPGYAWTIANCASCESHMGWRFTANSRKLKPKSFWGIRSSQVAEENL